MNLLRVENFFIELKKCNFNLINEIIFINDCSTDETEKKINDEIVKFRIFIRCKYICFFKFKK